MAQLELARSPSWLHLEFRFLKSTSLRSEMPKADDRNQKQHHEHQKQSKRVPRRRNTELENAAILAKRRTELLRERRILIVMTALCGVATAVSVELFIVSMHVC